MQRRLRAGFRAGSISMEEIEQDSIELLVACTMFWRDGEKTLTISGVEMECTPENVEGYTQITLDQGASRRGVSDRANFIKT